MKTLGPNWHTDHDNLMTLLYWAESECYPAATIVRMVEKTWKWRSEFVQAYCKSTDRERAERMRQVQFS